MQDAELIVQIRRFAEAQEATNNLLKQMLDYWKSMEMPPDNSYHEALKKEGVRLPGEKN